MLDMCRVAVSVLVVATSGVAAFAQETSYPRLPSIIRERSNISAGFLFRAHRSALRQSSDEEFSPRDRRLTAAEAKRVAVYHSAVLKRIRGKQYDEAPIALLAGYDLVRRGALKREDLPSWVRDLGDALAEERRRGWKPVAGKAPDELGVVLDLLLKAKDWRVKGGAEAARLALKLGLLDPLFPGGCVSKGYACTYTDQLQASGYTARSVETMVAFMLQDPQFAEVVDTFFNTSGITNFRFTTNPEDILRDNVDLATEADVGAANAKLDELLRRLVSLQEAEPPRADGSQATLEDRIAQIVRDESAALRQAVQVPEKPVDLVEREKTFRRTSERIEVAENGLALISTLVRTVDPKSAQRIEKLSGAIIYAAKADAAFRLSQSLGSGLAVANAYLSAGIVIVGLLESSQGPDVDQLILDSVADLSKQIESFRIEVRFRFDRLEELLIPMLQDLQHELSTVSVSLSEIKSGVSAIQDRMVILNERIDRMEQVLLDAVLDTEQLRYSDRVLTCFGGRTTTKISFETYSSCADTFVNWATSYAQLRGKALSAQGSPQDLTVMAAEAGRLGNVQLASLAKDESFPSLEPWLKGADAYLRLVSLHPEFSQGSNAPDRRNTPADLRDLIATGERLSAAMESIFFVNRNAQSGLGRRGPAPTVENDAFVRAIHKNVIDQNGRLVKAMSESVASVAAKEFRGYHPFGSGAPALDERTTIFSSEIAKPKLPQCHKRDVEFLPYLDLPTDWADEIPFGIKLLIVTKHASVTPCYRLTIAGLEHKFLGGLVGVAGRTAIYEEKIHQDPWDKLRNTPSGEITPGGARVTFVFEVFLDVTFNYPGYLRGNVPTSSYKIVIPYKLPWEWLCSHLRTVGAPLPAKERGPSGFPVSDDRLYCSRFPIIFVPEGYDFISIRSLANDVEFYDPFDSKVEPGGGLKDHVNAQNWPGVLRKQNAHPPLVSRSSEGIVSEYPRFDYQNNGSLFAMEEALGNRLSEHLVESAEREVFDPKGDGYQAWERFVRSISFYRSFLSKGLTAQVAQEATSTGDEMPSGSSYLSLVMRRSTLSKEEFVERLSGAAARMAQSPVTSAAGKSWEPDNTIYFDLAGDEGFKQASDNFITWQKDLLTYLKMVSSEGYPSEMIDVSLRLALDRLKQEQSRQELARSKP
ncbi:hypothetical protein CN135_27920 [Sinorhizobium meliloti]|uniref:hypothetical protein n=1 Tax=Rhizobium meliloti TaxID=382 RepID=UPI000FD74578|nr:hypothetical protein [Sinorhizobium meliloti]MDW9502235.1 hypothetical protein [Sinorhizobium meliloti]RVL73559.1 hypothetical protein CN135_27920 [Sinorhizobium meliloti]